MPQKKNKKNKDSLTSVVSRPKPKKVQSWWVKQLSENRKKEKEEAVLIEDVSNETKATELNVTTNERSPDFEEELFLSDDEDDEEETINHDIMDKIEERTKKNMDDSKKALKNTTKTMQKERTSGASIKNILKSMGDGKIKRKNIKKMTTNMMEEAFSSQLDGENQNKDIQKMLKQLKSGKMDPNMIKQFQKTNMLQQFGL